jgi:hypothetical protein
MLAPFVADRSPRIAVNPSIGVRASRRFSIRDTPKKLGRPISAPHRMPLAKQPACPLVRNYPVLFVATAPIARRIRRLGLDAVNAGDDRPLACANFDAAHIVFIGHASGTIIRHLARYCPRLSILSEDAVGRMATRRQLIDAVARAERLRPERTGAAALLGEEPL